MDSTKLLSTDRISQVRTLLLHLSYGDVCMSHLYRMVQNTGPVVLYALCDDLVSLDLCGLQIVSGSITTLQLQHKQLLLPILGKIFESSSFPLIHLQLGRSVFSGSRHRSNETSIEMSAKDVHPSSAELEISPTETGEVGPGTLNLKNDETLKGAETIAEEAENSQKLWQLSTDKESESNKTVHSNNQT